MEVDYQPSRKDKSELNRLVLQTLEESAEREVATVLLFPKRMKLSV